MRGAATASWLLAATAASVALAWRSPLPQDDPLRTTLILLPVVVVAFARIRHATVVLGGRQPPAVWRRGELVALALFVGLLLSRRSLGLLLADPLVVAAGALLLLAHVGRQILAMRPLLGRTLPARPSLLFLLLPLTAYLAVLPWSTEQRPPDGDEPWYLLVTHSIAYDFDVELTNNYSRRDWQGFLDREMAPQPGDPRGPRGEIYSRHNELLPLLLAPSYRLAGHYGALTTMAVLTALLSWMTLRLARHYVSERPGEALCAWALLSFAPPLLFYSHQVWVEIPAALLVVTAVDRIRVLRDRPSVRLADWLWLAAILLLLPIVKLRFALVSAPLLLLAGWHLRRHLRRQRLAVLLLTASVAAGGAGLLLVNRWLYGNPLKIHTWAELELYRSSPSRYALSLVGLFWDAAFGLFACAPLWMLLLPAVVLLVLRRQALMLDLTVVTVPYLLVVASRSEWYGGWSPPFRYGLVALPLLTLTLPPLLVRRRQSGPRLLLGGLGTLTVTLTLVWIAVPGWTYNLADGSTLLLDHLARRLGADVARFFPSSVEPRTATWLWPLLATPALLLLWWSPGRRLRGAAAAGVVLLFALLICLPVAARTLPTTLVELESPHVVKDGGWLYPPRWQFDRTRFREGWVLRQGDRLRAPVIAGGARVELAIRLRVAEPQAAASNIEVLASGPSGTESPLGVLQARSNEWEEHRIGPLSWPPNTDSIALRVTPSTRPGPRQTVQLDRILLRWR